ncbi:MAG: hydroxymethylglutaryl-CoA synthase family protein [Holophagales bacterium]|nr:hydroxymethylglutaryl-CoA synthase family protein [Holophagales bacterium]MYF93981.1 hydroxymethylglutaryl-CoA synthase family protein [Holophagales bacterium]
MSGIVRYGSYVPFNRIQRSAIGAGRGERAAASYDEDSASMAVEASREALRELPEGAAVDTVAFASTSAPYSEKLNAATLQAATNLPKSVTALDLGGSTRSGLSALLAGIDMASAGRTVLVAASDVVVGAPSGPRESGGGDAAAAFVLSGNGSEPVARLIGRASCTEEVLDVWKSPGMPFAKQWEERFGADVYTPLLVETFGRALADAGVSASDLSKVVLDGTNARVFRGFLRPAGVAPEQILDGLAGTVGRAGSAHAGLVLASALDGASAGDRIAVAVVADGVDVAVFEVTDAIDAGRPKHSVASWVESKRNDLAYTTYLKWREVLPFEPPRRPDPDRPAAPPMQRAERWKFGFLGSRCNRCGNTNLPPQRVCVVCQAVDDSTVEPYADGECRISTYTLDRLAYSLQPPVIGAVVDFDKGGRMLCQLTDVDPDNVGIGDELEMTFRRLYTAGGVHNYFWKARPKR